MSLIDPDLLLEKARQFARSDDFLGEGWQPAFQALVGAVEAEAGLGPSRTERFAGEMLTLLVTRTRMAALLRARPDIPEVDLGAPLVVTGLPRSGTTLLHNLLAQVPGNRAFRLWELRAPALAADTSGALDQPRRELDATAEVVRWLYERAPAFRSIHPMAADAPDECNWLLRPTFTTPVFGWANHVPSYEVWLSRADARPAYAEWRLQLQMLRWRSPGGRLVLKDPGHLWNLDALLDTLPETRVVVMDRALDEAVASFCSLCATLQGMDAEARDPLEVGRSVVARVQEGRARMKEAMARRPDRFLVVPYPELVADPVATVGRIQAWAGRPFDGRSEVACRGFLARQVRAAPHAYDRARYGVEGAVI